MAGQVASKDSELVEGVEKELQPYCLIVRAVVWVDLFRVDVMQMDVLRVDVVKIVSFSLR